MNTCYDVTDRMQATLEISYNLMQRTPRVLLIGAVRWADALRHMTVRRFLFVPLLAIVIHHDIRLGIGASLALDG